MNRTKNKKFLLLEIAICLLIIGQIIGAAELTPAQKEAERIKNNQLIDDEFHYTEFKTPGVLNILQDKSSDKTQENINYLIGIIIFGLIILVVIVFALILKNKNGVSKFRG
jgi:hypothetical protein